MSCCGQGRRALARTGTRTSPAGAASPGPARVTAPPATLAATPAATAKVIQLALGLARAGRRQRTSST